MSSSDRADHPPDSPAPSPSPPPPARLGSDPAELHRLLVHSVGDYAIFALDPDGVILSWNQGAERIKGYRPSEIIGSHFSRFYPESDLAEGKPARELEIASAVGRFEEEGWRLRKDGSPFWASVVLTALRDASGALVGFAKVTRDLSERRAFEQSLRASEERFRLLVGSVKDYGIFMLDPQGVVASWNEGAERIKGYRASEIIGRHFSTFYPPEDIASDKPARELEIAIAEGRFEEEGWRLRKDGSPFWANVVITTLRGESGHVVGFTKVTRDLTERREAHARELENARRVADAEGANRAKSEFLASMSHELRTPLNAIGGYAELLQLDVGGALNEQQREWVTRIRTSQQHLLHIITDLLNYSRIEAGELRYEFVDVEARDLIGTVLPLIEPQAATRELQLRVDCGSGLMVRADRIKAEQVLLNLLSNAVKFTPPGGEIVVSCRRDGDVAILSVRDTGVGIAADKQLAVFEPFVQLGRALTGAHEGTGLGLAISRDMARAMDGDVTIESTPGVGSVFSLTLPVALPVGAAAPLNP